jgi:hypothetical protein
MNEVRKTGYEDIKVMKLLLDLQVVMVQHTESNFWIEIREGI